MLCGGVTALIRTGFETLVAACYQPELAHFECLHEMKLIVDLMYQGGMSYMRYSVSDTAEYGDYNAGPRIVDERVRDTMRSILADIQDGSFATRRVLENQAGRPSFNAMRRAEPAMRRAEPSDRAGRQGAAGDDELAPAEGRCDR